MCTDHEMIEKLSSLLKGISSVVVFYLGLPIHFFLPVFPHLLVNLSTLHSLCMEELVFIHWSPVPSTTNCWREREMNHTCAVVHSLLLMIANCLDPPFMIFELPFYIRTLSPRYLCQIARYDEGEYS